MSDGPRRALGENESAVAVANDFPRLIDDILQVLPRPAGLHGGGSGPIGRFWRKKLETEFARFRDRVTFIWSDELSLQDILRRCASLPGHSAIVYITLGTDAQGGAYADEQVLAALHATANAPLFGAQSHCWAMELSVGRWCRLAILVAARATWPVVS
jgi:predicted NBD/HSP70 family sugar kinase